LSVVVQRVSKKSYGTFLRDEVFRPHGMVRSWVYEDPTGAPKHEQLGFINAVGYQVRRRTFEEGWGSPPFRSETLLTTGDGGVWTSLEDLRNFDAAVRDGKLLRAETMKRALTPSKTRDGKTNPYGLGWAVTPDRSEAATEQWHDGGWRGFRTLYF